MRRVLLHVVPRCRLTSQHALVYDQVNLETQTIREGGTERKDLGDCLEPSGRCRKSGRQRESFCRSERHDKRCQRIQGL